MGDGPVFKGEIRTIQKGTTLSIFRMSFSRMSTSKRICVVLSSLALLLGAMSIVAFGSSAQAKIAAAPASGTVVTVVPQRIADSRTGMSWSTFHALQTQDLQIVGRGGVPLTGVAGAVLNVTAVNPSQDGYLTVWPVGMARTDTSNVNFTRLMSAIANTVIVRLSSDGSVSLFNGSLGQLDVLVDVQGYIPA